MKVAPVERPVASAAYSFVRFSGGAIAPFLAGKLAEHVERRRHRSTSARAPSSTAVGVTIAGRALLTATEERPSEEPDVLEEAEDLVAAAA